MSRKRPLTSTMIRNLERATGIPASILIQPYATVQEQGDRWPRPRAAGALGNREAAAAG